MPEDKPTEEDTGEPETTQGKYLLCPACAQEGITKGFEDMGLLSGHFNFHHAKKGLKFKDWRDKITYTDKKPPNLLRQRQKKGGSMPDEDSEMITPDMGDSARVRGKIKRLLINIGRLPESERESVLESREELLEYLRVLSAKDVGYDTIRSIEGLIDSDISPRISSASGDDNNQHPESYTDAAEKNIPTDLKMRIARIRSRIKGDLQSIANLPVELADSITGEKEVLLDLNRTLYRDNLTPKEVQDIDARHGSIHPFIEAASKKGHKPKHNEESYEEDDIDDEMERERYKRVQNRLRRAQLKRDLLEEEQALKRLQESSNTTQNHAIQPIPVMRPKMDPKTNEVMRDEHGQVITEVAYQYPSATGMDPLMATMMQLLLNNLAGPRNSGEDKMANTLLEMKKQELEFKKEMMELELRLREGNSKNPEIEEMRRMNQNMQERYYNDRLAAMQNSLENARAMANRDQLSDLLNERDRLIKLGLAAAPNAGVPDKNVEYANSALRETVTRLDKTIDTVKEGMRPIVELQTEYMKKSLEKQASAANATPSASPAVSKPGAMTPEEKQVRWGELLRRIDQS